MAKTTERVKFSLIQMPCCGQLLCWVNPRLPNFCVECGSPSWIHLHPEAILYTDEEAILQVEDKMYLRSK